MGENEWQFLVVRRSKIQIDHWVIIEIVAMENAAFYDHHNDNTYTDNNDNINNQDNFT